MFDKVLITKRIVVNPHIHHGRPCIKGTRTPVHIILEALATGMSFEQVQREFDPITLEDIQACIYYAALLADEQELQPAA